MKNHLDPTVYSILENTLSETLYEVDVIDKNNNLPSIKDATNDYILMLYETDRCMQLSEKTLNAYFETLKEFTRYVDKPFVYVKTEDINYYLMHKKKEGNSHCTLNNKRRNLSSFFCWLKKKQFVQINPVDDSIFFKVISKPVDYMTAVEFDQLRNGCKSKRDRALIEYLRCTASRRGEVVNVQINNINWMDGTILIYAEKTYEYRTVMIDAVCKKYLMEYLTEERKVPLDSNLPLFTCNKGDTNKALKASGIYAIVKKIAKNAGLDRSVYPHLFRKTCATNIVRRGGSESDAGFYLGHKPSGVTESHYIGRTEEQRKEIFKNCVETV